MRRSLRPLLVSAFLVLLAGCASTQTQTVPITLIQLNDVYEIMPLRGGTEGGLARVATLEKELRAENPHTFMMFAGDLFSPSALGTARIDGVPLAGRQIVDMMNVIGLDYATFGNHEFDIAEPQFLQRLAESEFLWVSSNVFNAAGEPFPGVVTTHVFEVDDGKRRTARIGLLGVTMQDNRRKYVRYEDPVAAAVSAAKKLRSSVDVVIALTHLALEDDIRIAREAPEIDLILGGHEHENVQIWRGDTRLIPITKADANARTIYIHELTFDVRSRDLNIRSRVQPVDNSIAEDATAARLASEWVERAYSAFRAQGFDPESIVAVSDEILVATESAVRNRPTTATQLITSAMRLEVPDADLAIFNGGSIRMDDELSAGPVTQYDVIRLLPFGGDIFSVRMNGDLLARVLDQGVRNRGSGGFLHHDGVTKNENETWLVQGQPISPERIYTVAISDYLMSGQEVGLGFLTLDAPGVESSEKKRDIRFALIAEMQRRWPGPKDEG